MTGSSRLQRYLTESATAGYHHPTHRRYVIPLRASSRPDPAIIPVTSNHAIQEPLPVVELKMKCA
jgi:hypothetical protein